MEYLYYHPRIYLKMTKEDSDRKKDYANASSTEKGNWYRLSGSIKGVFKLRDDIDYSKRKTGPKIKSPITEE